MLKSLKKYKIEILLWIFIILYIIIFSYLSIRRLYTLNSNYYDLGIMHQVVYNTSQGRFLEMTNQDFGKNISRLAVHFDPILAIFAPMYKLYNGPEVLLIIQTIILGLGALAVFLISKNIIKNKGLSLILAASYLFYYPVQRANLFDFHPATLATASLLFVIYFSLIKRYWSMLFFIFLSFLTKEHVGLIIVFFGLYLFFLKKERKASLFLIFLGLIVFFLTVDFIIPYFRQESHFALKYFGDFGDSPKNVLLGFIKNPLLVLKLFFRKETFIYLESLLISHGLLIIFSPIEFLIGLPEMMINILSSNSNMRMIYFHYNSLIVPFIIFSAICGLSKINKTDKLKKYTNIILLVFILLNMVSIYLFNPLPFSFLKQPYWWGAINQDKLTIIKTWNQKLGDNEKVATTPRLAPFFSGRRYYHNFLYDTGYVGIGISDNDIIKAISNYTLADYVIIDKSEIFGNKNDKLPKLFYNALFNNIDYQKIYSDRTGIEVYKKI